MDHQGSKSGNNGTRSGSDAKSSSPTKGSSTTTANNNNNVVVEGYRFPEGVKVPSSIDSTLLQGDVVDILKQLPHDRINAAFETYDSQYKQRGSEIRNPRAYLRGILKGSAGRYGLPSAVYIPPSITQSMLEDKDLIEVLKPMSVRDINTCFRDFDDQIKKKSEMIRNKNAYLLGIIRSGPHYSLPHGVVLPPTVSLAMLQGELLETIQKLPAAQINLALTEYDEQILKKSDTIRNKQGYLLGIIKRMKRTIEEEASEHVASQHQPTKSTTSSSSPSPNKTSRDGYSHPIAGSSPRNSGSYQSSSVTGGGAKTEANGTTTPRSSPIKQQQGESSPDTLNLIVKVTNELVLERNAKKNLEDQLKQEITRREETNQRVLKLMSALATEKEQRERSALEVERLKKDLAFERSLRETVEEKVQMLEENRVSYLQHQQQSFNSDGEQDQVRKLELELSIERGLRENTEKLLQAAENRIEEFDRELKYLREKLQEERVKSPFGNWTSTSFTATDVPDSKDKKTPELPSSLSGISDLVSLTTFDPESFGFTKAEYSHIVNNNQDGTSTLSSELNAASSIYGKDEIVFSQGQITRRLNLDVSQTMEKVQVHLNIKIAHNYPDHGTLAIDAMIADKAQINESAQRFLEDSLPDLVEVCRSAAQHSKNNDALVTVLTTADYWAQVDWFDMQTSYSTSNGVSSKDARNGSAEQKSMEICRLLLQTSSINDFFTLKYLATKHGLGGYAKVGAPGYLLVEGSQVSCDKFLGYVNLRANETTTERLPKARWSTFVVVGKSIRPVEKLKASLLLPVKVTLVSETDGIGKLKGGCHLVGLTEAADKIILP